jgi:hypothetical protein
VNDENKSEPILDRILDSAALWSLCISSGNLGAGCGESDADFSRLTRLLLDGNLVIASDGRQKRKQGGRCLEVHRWTRITIDRVHDWPG